MLYSRRRPGAGRERHRNQDFTAATTTFVATSTSGGFGVRGWSIHHSARPARPLVRSSAVGATWSGGTRGPRLRGDERRHHLAGAHADPAPEPLDLLVAGAVAEQHHPGVAGSRARSRTSLSRIARTSASGVPSRRRLDALEERRQVVARASRAARGRGPSSRRSGGRRSAWSRRRPRRRRPGACPRSRARPKSRPAARRIRAALVGGASPRRRARSAWLPKSNLSCNVTGE